MQHKRKKVNKYRAHTTHGCGSMKKRRGKGNKGGAGRAGSGKRADQKKPMYWKEQQKKGFTSKGVVKAEKTVTLRKVQELITAGKLKDQNGIYDLSSLKFTKLLATGTVGSALKLKIDVSTSKAVEKVEAAGGSVEADVSGDGGFEEVEESADEAESKE